MSQKVTLFAKQTFYQRKLSINVCILDQRVRQNWLVRSFAERLARDVDSLAYSIHVYIFIKSHLIMSLVFQAVIFYYVY